MAKSRIKKHRSWTAIAVALLMIVSIVTNICPYSAQAATPKVLVSNYKVSTPTIYSGDSFDLTLEIQNTSQNKVRNMKVTVDYGKCGLRADIFHAGGSRTCREDIQAFGEDGI